MGQPLIGVSARLSEKQIKADYWVAIVATSAIGSGKAHQLKR